MKLYSVTDKRWYAYTFARSESLSMSSMPYLRRAILIIISIVAGFALSECLLRVLDPWGVRYYDDVQSIWAASAPSDEGYTFRPGIYNFGATAFSIEPDGTRTTPGRAATGPRVAFIGDSVTFAQGVNDADVWVSLVAAELGLNARNYGRPSFSVTNVARVAEHIRGCVVFLTISNDAAGLQTYRTARPYADLWLMRYLYAAVTSANDPLPIKPEHDQLFRAVASRPDTLILAFDDGNYGNIMRDEYGAILIPPFTSRISRADAHANAAGNREIATAAAPIIADWIEAHDCY